ncbi:MAG: hypothetical protein ACRD3Q_08150 [Terriglobales bacterium]
MKNKIVGALNLAFSVIGLLSIGFSIMPILRGFVIHNVESHIVITFWVMTSMNASFIVLLAMSGAKLTRGDGRGVKIANGTYIAEITYFLCIGFLWLSPFGDAIAGATGGGNMGIAPQVITLFPVFALLVLNVRFHRNAPQMTSDQLDKALQRSGSAATTTSTFGVTKNSRKRCTTSIGTRYGAD